MLTQDEIERRKRFITASEIPAIIGVSPYANAADVYMNKIYGSRWKGNEATEAGNILEPSVLKWAETQLGPIVPGNWCVHEDGLIACTLDAQLAETGEPVEAKTSGIVGPGFPQLWGEELTDEVPEYYLVQVQTQLLVKGKKKAYLPALIGNRGFVMYVVNENKEFQAYIKAECQAFWKNHIEPQIKPTNITPNLETVRNIARVSGKSVQVDDRLAVQYIAAKEAAKLANEKADEAQAALIAAIGDGEVAKWSGGEFTFREQTRKGYVVNESTFRVLRAKPTKGDAKCLAK